MEKKNDYPTLAGRYLLIRMLTSECELNSRPYVAVRIPDNKLYFVKLEKECSSDSERDKIRRMFVNERKIIEKLDHPNVVHFVEYIENADFVKPNGQKSKSDAIVLELAIHGDMFEDMGRNGPYSESVARFYFFQLLQSLEYIHSKRITHRDMKPHNLLLDDTFNLKLADFGCSREYKEGEMLLGRGGSIRFMAPEMLVNQAYYGPEIDVFGAGIILFRWITGVHPFKKSADAGDLLYSKMIKNKEQFWHEINLMMSGFCNAKLSEEFKDVIHQMLELDPEERPDFEDIREHPWLNMKMATRDEVLNEMTRRFKHFENDYLSGLKKKEVQKKEEVMPKEPDVRKDLDRATGGVDEAANWNFEEEKKDEPFVAAEACIHLPQQTNLASDS